MVSPNYFFDLILQVLDENPGVYLSAEQLQTELIVNHATFLTVNHISAVIREKAKPALIDVKERASSKEHNLYKTPYELTQVDSG